VLVGLGKWASVVTRRTQPKDERWAFSTKQKSPPSRNGPPSRREASAAIHHVQTDLLSYGDKAEVGDHDHAVARTVEDLAVAASDASRSQQEEEARTTGGIPFR